MIDVPHSFQVIREQCQALRGAEYCTDRVVQAIAAISRHETGFSTYKPFARPATSNEPAWVSHNYGAMQCSVIADKSGACPKGCFPARDTSPTSTGASIGYLGCFQVHPTEEEGVRALVKLITVHRPKIAAALPSGDAQQIASAMHASKYFEGFGKTIEARIRGYAEALHRNASANAREARAELLIELPPPPPPTPPDGSAEEALAFTAAGLIAAFFARMAKKGTDP